MNKYFGKNAAEKLCYEFGERSLVGSGPNLRMARKAKGKNEKWCSEYKFKLQKYPAKTRWLFWL